MSSDTYSETSSKPHYAKVFKEDLSSDEVRKLGPAAFRVWVTLKAEAFTDKGFGVVQELLGDYTGYGRRTIQRSLLELKNAGLLKSAPRHNKKGEQIGNHWTVLEPPSVMDLRLAGTVPPQKPPGRHKCRPPWRHDRHPRASETPPYVGVTGGALHIVKRVRLVSVYREAGDRCTLANAASGRWPGLLRRVSDAQSTEAMRILAQWATTVRRPTPEDVQQRFRTMIHELLSKDRVDQVVEFETNSGYYDLESGGRSASRLNHAIRSCFGRASKRVFRDLIFVIGCQINELESGDSKGITKVLRRLWMRAA